MGNLAATLSNIYNGTLLSHKKEREAMPFAATWMDLEVITLGEVSQTEKQMPPGTTYMWDLNWDTKELSYKTDSHIYKTDLWLQSGRRQTRRLRSYIEVMAAHSSALAWKIRWMEEPGGLQSMGSLRVGHD